MIMASIQALSNAVHAMAERHQPQQPREDVPVPEVVAVPPLPPIVPEGVPVPEATVAPPPPPVAPAEPVEPTGITPTAAQHKAFMSTKPPQFTGRKGADRAEEWLEEVEKAFDIMDIPVRHWVRFDTFLLVEDAKAWWKTLLDIREHRIREFLEIVQSGRSIADYAARFRHFQCYSPHLFGSERERASRFVWGLDEGLRPRVMSSNPPTLLQAVEMATRMEDDYRRSQALVRKQKGLGPIAQQFKKGSGASKASRPPLARPATS
ncbi:unnamed protein product [Victoria cruziana]